MTTSYVKDPDATLDFGLDWAPWLGTDTITNSTWTVDTGLTVVDDTNDTTTTTIWLSGGTIGTRYKAVNHVTTAGGRQDDRTLSITVQPR